MSSDAVDPPPDTHPDDTPPTWDRLMGAIGVVSSMTALLVHTIQLDHSPNFWELVSERAPNSKDLNRELKTAWAYVPPWAYEKWPSSFTRNGDNGNNWTMP